MIQVRVGTFETNSSSTHSLVITTEDIFQQFKKGKLVYCQWDDGPFKEGEFYPKEEVDAYADEHEDDFEEYNFQTFEEMFEESCLESYEKHFETPHGDKMVAFGNYGYDG